MLRNVIRAGDFDRFTHIMASVLDRIDYGFLDGFVREVGDPHRLGTIAGLYHRLVQVVAPDYI
ncbi:MAG: hypothetical protein ACOYM2_20070 [Rectinemataceae bacterium]